jgi:hypothetical protein
MNRRIDVSRRKTTKVKKEFLGRPSVRPLITVSNDKWVSIDGKRRGLLSSILYHYWVKRRRKLFLLSSRLKEIRLIWW